MKRHLPWPGIAVWNFKADSIIIRTHGFYFRQKKYKERFLVLVHSFIITITPTQLYYQIRAIVPRAAIRIVTECICTLCLCCCLYSGCVALSVFFRVCTSVDLLRMRYVLWFTRHYETREGEREEQWPLACTIQKKRRNKIRKLWLWLVCCSLLPTCNFHHRPFTAYTCQ